MNKKIAFTICLILICSHSFSKDKVKVIKSNRVTKSNHELYILDVGTGGGFLLKNRAKVDELRLFGKPNLKGKVVRRIPLNTNKERKIINILGDFFQGRGAYGSVAIYSRERRGDFFKVKHKNMDGWLYKGELYKIIYIEDFLKEIKFSIRIKWLMLADVPGGKRLFPQNITNRRSESHSSGTGVELKVLGSAWHENKLWLRVKVLGYEDNMERISIEEIEGWIHPYNVEGQALYGYSYKGRWG